MEAVPDDLDYREEERPVSDATMDQIRRLAKELAAKTDAVAKAEAEVTKAKQGVAELRDGLLPSLLKSNAINHLDVEGVGTVSWKADIVGSLPSLDKRPAERAAALAWLEANAAGLIKRELTAMMPKHIDQRLSRGQRDQIKDLLKRAPLPRSRKGTTDESLTVSSIMEQIIQILAPGTEVSTDLSVHAGTLCKWGREMTADGKDVPLKLLGLSPVDRASIKR